MNSETEANRTNRNTRIRRFSCLALVLLIGFVFASAGCDLGTHSQRYDEAQQRLQSGQPPVETN